VLHRAAVTLVVAAAATGCLGTPTGPFDDSHGIRSVGFADEKGRFFDGGWSFPEQWEGADIVVIDAVPASTTNVRHVRTRLTGPDRRIGSWILGKGRFEDTASATAGTLVTLPAGASLRELSKALEPSPGSADDGSWVVVLEYELTGPDVIGLVEGVRLTYELDGRRHVDVLDVLHVACGTRVPNARCNEVGERETERYAEER
jgi:hypothetical protein